MQFDKMSGTIAAKVQLRRKRPKQRFYEVYIEEIRLRSKEIESARISLDTRRSSVIGFMMSRWI